MNLALYGYGPRDRENWIMVDCGVTFPGPDLPGVDLVLPDIGFLAEKRDAICRHRSSPMRMRTTTARCSTCGRRLNVPVYATPFTAGLLEAKRAGRARCSEGAGDDLSGRRNVPGRAFRHRGGRGQPFDPGAVSLAIPRRRHRHPHRRLEDRSARRKSARSTDEARFRALGDEGVLALICDSTNAMREGVSPSEQAVGEGIKAEIQKAPGRVAITTFSSNVGRIRPMAEAARDAGRQVLVLGRS